MLPWCVKNHQKLTIDITLWILIWHKCLQIVIFALNDIHDMCLNKILKYSTGSCQSKGLNWPLVFHTAN